LVCSYIFTKTRHRFSSCSIPSLYQSLLKRSIWTPQAQKGIASIVKNAPVAKIVDTTVTVKKETAKPTAKKRQNWGKTGSYA
jgi:hypothetical protein